MTFRCEYRSFVLTCKLYYSYNILFDLPVIDIIILCACDVCEKIKQFAKPPTERGFRPQTMITVEPVF